MFLRGAEIHEPFTLEDAFIKKIVDDDKTLFALRCQLLEKQQTRLDEKHELDESKNLH